MTCAELLVLAAVVFGAAWLLWDRDRHHTEPSITKPAVKKMSEAAVQGWWVIRVTGAMVADGRAVTYLERALNDR